MFKNYFKTAWRYLLKYKAFSFINIFGLAATMSVCMLVILMLSDQLNYDSFHQKKDRIYRVVSTPKKETRLRATVPFPVAAQLKSNYPAVEDVVLLRRGLAGDAIYNQHYSSIIGYFSSPSFFNVFSYGLEAGDEKTCLQNPNTLVITHEVAKRLFGNDNPIGKTIRFSDRGSSEWTDETSAAVDWGLFTITGVVAEHAAKSHLPFDAIASASTMARLQQEQKIKDIADDWGTDHMAFIYALLKPSAKEKDLGNALEDISNKNFKNSSNESVKEARLTYQPLTKITPGAVVNNAPSNTLPLFVYYVLGGLLAIILLTSCLNYVSLSIARSITRSGEIGLRKVVGAERRDLIAQFLCETLVTVFLSLLLANVFLIFLKTAFMQLWVNGFLKFDLQFNVYVYLAFVGFGLLVSLISGFYPAFKMSKANALTMLKKSDGNGKKRFGLRRALTVSQFAISLLFVITSMVIYNQFKHYMKYDYGFNPKSVVNVNLQSSNFQLVKNTLKDVAGVEAIAGCAYLPSTGRNDGLTLEEMDKSKKLDAVDLSVSDNFTSVIGIPLLAGKNIVTNANGESDQVMINEVAAQRLGFKNAGEAVGHVYRLWDKNVQVVGVVKNFTISLLFDGRAIMPLVFRANPSAIKFASIKMATADEKQVMRELAEKWKMIDPIHPMQFELYQDKLSDNNKGIFDLVSIIGLIAFLAITISCLGMLGMAIYTTERRTKEIGIRKVLGANEWSLNLMLAREFLLMLGLAILIAAPLAFFLNNFWLNYMTVREDMSIVTVFLGSLLLVLLGVITIVPQTFRIASSNPIESLRTE